jgi:Hint domain
MATLTWNGFSGTWTDSTQWLTNVVPGAGDTAVFPIGSADMSGVAIVNETIDIIGGTQLSWKNTTFDAASNVVFNNGTLFTLADAGSVTNNGTMAYGSGAGEIDLYLIPGTSANFANNGMFSLSEPFKMLGFGNFINAGTLVLQNLAGTAVAMTVMSPATTITNNGSFIVDGLGSPSASTTATVNAVSGTGTIALTDAQFFANSTVAATQTFEFLDAHGALALNLPAAPFNATITGFQPGDSIDLGTTQADAVSFDGGVLTITYQSMPKYMLNIVGPYQTPDFNLNPNALSHEVLTTTVVPCFASGTRISTVRGEIAVEDMQAGDLVHVEQRGDVRSVVWIGHRQIDCTRHPNPRAVWPVRVRAGAFGGHRPHRDLWLSPDHAVCVADVLIPVKYLINDSTIAQVPVDSVSYYHVELPIHGVIFAEGLPAETYLDAGDRMNFDNGGELVALYPDFATRASEATACAPIVITGPMLAAVRMWLAEQAKGRATG